MIEIVDHKTRKVIFSGDLPEYMIPRKEGEKIQVKPRDFGVPLSYKVVRLQRLFYPESFKLRILVE